MRLKLIACNVFTREACWCAARSPHILDIEFVELGEHVHPEALRARVQSLVDAASASGRGYDAILLLLGLCGNAGTELQARNVRLVMPRAHDCCTILLGSRDVFKEHFAEAPSTPFSSSGYVERGDYYLRTQDGETDIFYGDLYAKYVEQYGEENARYIWETMHPRREQPGQNRAVFIELPQTAHLGYADRIREQAEADGKEFVLMQGDLRLIDNLLSGQWDEAEFLIVEPGKKTAGVYDWDEIVRAVDANA